eukprot:6210301-Pleurochrysis_carterae.AAC.1
MQQRSIQAFSEQQAWFLRQHKGASNRDARAAVAPPLCTPAPLPKCAALQVNSWRTCTMDSAEVTQALEERQAGHHVLRGDMLRHHVESSAILQEPVTSSSF